MSWAWLKEIFAAEEAGREYPGAAARAVNKPRLAVVNYAPGRDDFVTWRDNAVTLFVFAALRNAAAEQKTAWDDVSWHGNEADPLLLTELRTRADAYEALEGGDYEAFCEWAGVPPEQNNAA